jgi:hypothetical protein
MFCMAFCALLVKCMDVEFCFVLCQNEARVRWVVCNLKVRLVLPESMQTCRHAGQQRVKFSFASAISAVMANVHSWHFHACHLLSGFRRHELLICFIKCQTLHLHWLLSLQSVQQIDNFSNMCVIESGVLML